MFTPEDERALVEREADEVSRHIDFQKYQEFVDAVTSDESRDFLALSDRLVSLDEKGANIERLMTGAIGINAEGGEIMEIVKKLVFQGKPWNEETRFHIKRELGDVMWYVMQCLIALDLTLDEVIEGNIDKLKKRYPGGIFDPYYSENRQEGDL
jgi:NTP pyrophosphatase (non-canonical NTP hydrolase)